MKNCHRLKRLNEEYQDALPSSFTNSDLCFCPNFWLTMCFSSGMGIWGEDGNFDFFAVCLLSPERKKELSVLTGNFTSREATSSAVAGEESLPLCSLFL